MSTADGRARYWTRFYGRLNQDELSELCRPSAFARWCARQLTGRPVGRLVDLGCGTGRDSIFWASAGWRVVAVDNCREALTIAAARSGLSRWPICFRLADLAAAGDACASADVAYARWVLHAIDQAEQDRLLERLGRMKPGALLAVEARAALESDPANDHVETLVGDHYRRRLDPPRLRREIEGAGFRLVAAELGEGLSVQGTDDPRLLRFICAASGSARIQQSRPG